MSIKQKRPLYTAPVNDYSRFISLLDTPPSYEDGKLLILNKHNECVLAVDLVNVPSLDEGVVNALSRLLGNSHTISFDVDIDNKLVVAKINDNCIAPINIETTNKPKENYVLVYSEGSFEWRHSADIIDLEAQVSISTFQPVTESGYIAKAIPPITNRAIGLAITNAVANAYVRVQTGSAITNSYWDWSVGANIYLQVDGSLGETAPTSGFIQVIGTAIKPTTILLVQQPIIFL